MAMRMPHTSPTITRRAASWLSLLLGAMRLGLGLGFIEPPVHAYPPALPHTFFGMVRDEQGNPLPAGASIILETSAGTKVFGVVSGVLEPGVNYRLPVPLDAGLTSEAYKPTALNPRTPFKIKIKVGNAILLPIEMTHEFAHMGEPGKSTLLNLTLGVDSNGDGLPDAWQRRISSDLDQVKPDADSDHDGLSNLEEYLAGTYAYDTQSGFTLSILRSTGDAPVLAFTAIAGRTYTLLGSSDLTHWSPVRFRLLPADADSATLSTYTAPDVRPVQVEVVLPPEEEIPSAFKLMLE